MQSDDPQELSFATDRLPWQRSLRWTRPTLDKRRIAWGVLLGIVVTAIELIGFGLGMRRQIAKETLHAPTDAVQVYLIPDTNAVPEPPEIEPPIKPERPATTQRRHPVAQRSSRAPRALINVVSTPETPTLRLYDPDGRMRLPDDVTPRTNEEIGFSQHALASPRDAFARDNPLPYEPTRFESVWAPSRETLGRELVRKTTWTRTWRTPWGTEIGCTVSFLTMLGGCGWGFAPTATIEELKAMRADPPMLRHPEFVNPDSATTGTATDKPPPSSSPLLLSLPVEPVDPGP